MRTLLQDLRFGARLLAARPAFAVAAVVTLALGIGATTAAYSVVRAVLFAPLPYRDPGRLMMVWNESRAQGRRAPSISPGDFLDLGERAASFEGFAAIYSRTTSLTGDGEPEQINVGRVSHDFLPLLGIHPAEGRGFLSQEDVFNGPKVVVLGHGLWVRRFGSDRGVVGRVIHLNGVGHTVVGVLPADFRLLLPAEVPFAATPDVLVPLQLSAADWGRNYFLLTVIGRLKPGATVETAQAEVNAVAAALRAEHQVHDSMGTHLDIRPLHDDVVKGVSPALLVLSWAVGFVLLIACANTAGLLLARATGREKEIGIRSALGASPGRILRQVLTESLLLGLLGGAAGLALAALGVKAVAALGPAQMPRLDEVEIDASGLALTAGVSLLTALLFGLAPAAAAAGARPLDALNGVRAGGRARGARLLDAIVVAEVALSLTLLVGAGLLARSFAALHSVHPGFDADGVYTFKVFLPAARYPKAGQVTEFFRQLEARIAALPGVESAGVINFLPLSGEGFETAYAYDAETELNWESKSADRRNVTPGYFRAMGVRLLAGRLFDGRDAADKPFVVVVDENLARTAWPGENPLGKRIKVEYRTVGGRAGDERKWAEVVGVVEHVRARALTEGAGAQVYYHYEQQPVNVAAVAVRAPSAGEGLEGLIKTQVRALDPDLPLYAARPMRDYVTDATAQTRFVMLVLGAFGAAALVLAAVGIYGVLSQAVSERARELGIRAALGARPRDILRLVLVKGMALTLLGIGAGVAGSLALTRLVAGLLFGVSALDPVTFTLVPLVLAAASLTACLIPARRAARLDPLSILRRP